MSLGFDSFVFLWHNLTSCRTKELLETGVLESECISECISLGEFSRSVESEFLKVEVGNPHV